MSQYCYKSSDLSSPAINHQIATQHEVGNIGKYPNPLTPELCFSKALKKFTDYLLLGILCHGSRIHQLYGKYGMVP